MSTPPLRRPAYSRHAIAGVELPRWRKREVVASAVIAVTSVFVAWFAWTTPHGIAERLFQSAVACGGFAAARAPRMLFLPTAWADAQGAGLVVPLAALRLAQLGQGFLIAAAGCWLGSWLL